MICLFLKGAPKNKNQSERQNLGTWEIIGRTWHDSVDWKGFRIPNSWIVIKLITSDMIMIQPTEFPETQKQRCQAPTIFTRWFCYIHHGKNPWAKHGQTKIRGQIIGEQKTNFNLSAIWHGPNFRFDP